MKEWDQENSEDYKLPKKETFYFKYISRYNLIEILLPRLRHILMFEIVYYSTLQILSSGENLFFF